MEYWVKDKPFILPPRITHASRLGEDQIMIFQGIQKYKTKQSECRVSGIRYPLDGPTVYTLHIFDTDTELEATFNRDQSFKLGDILTLTIILP